MFFQHENAQDPRHEPRFSKFTTEILCRFVGDGYHKTKDNSKRKSPK